MLKDTMGKYRSKATKLHFFNYIALTNVQSTDSMKGVHNNMYCNRVALYTGNWLRDWIVGAFTTNIHKKKAM
jgi:hypothetical protein